MPSTVSPPRHATPAPGASVSERLCSYALGVDGAALPLAACERVGRLFLDYLAVALGGHRVADSTGTFVRGATDLARGAAGSATVIGERTLYPPQYAALLNGALAHSMDYDDNHWTAMHPGAPIFSAALALAEDSGATGADFLAAVVAGYDIAIKLAKAHGTSVIHRGFHATATTGLFACTLAGARVLGMPFEQAVNAVGLNISQAAGAMQFLSNGAWDKRVHTGLAAHNAILALFLARQGYRGSSEPIEGKYGYFALYANDPGDPMRALEGLGKDFEAMNTAVKPYPCCRCSHAAMDAVLALVADNGIASADVDSMEIEISEHGFRFVADPPTARREPANIVDAQFSLFFAAAACTTGSYTWDSYNLIDAPMIRGLMGRITVTASKTIEQYGARVTLATRDGRRLFRHVALPKGEPEVPLSAEECERKFREWADPAIGAERGSRVIEMAGRLDRLPDMRGLTRLLRGD